MEYIFIHLFIFVSSFTNCLFRFLAQLSNGYHSFYVLSIPRILTLNLTCIVSNTSLSSQFFKVFYIFFLYGGRLNFLSSQITNLSVLFLSFIFRKFTIFLWLLQVAANWAAKN